MYKYIHIYEKSWTRTSPSSAAVAWLPRHWNLSLGFDVHGPLHSLALPHSS